MATIDASEVRELAVALAAEAKRVGREAATAIRSRATDLQRRAETLAPRRTGDLARSITVEHKGMGNSASMSASIGPTARHGRFQEFGTAKMRPQPFMGPALDEVGPKLADDIDRIMDSFLA